MLLLLILAAQTVEGNYRVATRDEFLEALGSNRTIVVEEGAKITLSFADEFPPEDPLAEVSWSHNFDGASLVLRNIENLTITGEGIRGSALMAEPRYVFILEFQQCSGIRIENLLLGHTSGGFCDCGVLGFYHCSGISIDNCLLYGCGTEGLTAWNTEGLTMTACEIADCAYGTMTCRDSSGLLFEDCIFRNNMEYYSVLLHDCAEVVFRGCTFLEDEFEYHQGFISNDSDDTVIVENCSFPGEERPFVVSSGGEYSMTGNTFTGVSSAGQ